MTFLTVKDSIRIEICPQEDLDQGFLVWTVSIRLVVVPPQLACVATEILRSRSQVLKMTIRE